jgi:hypothetical protein
MTATTAPVGVQEIESEPLRRELVRDHLDALKRKK